MVAELQELTLVDYMHVSDIVVANRLSYDIKNVKEKVVTRDLFGHDQ